LIVDLHAHYWPAPYLDQLERCGADVSYQRKQLWASDSEPDVARRIRMMDDARVDVQVISPGGPMPYFSSEDAGVTSARLANDLYHEFTLARPDRIGAFGVVPLPHIDAAISEASRALDELDLAGIGIGTSVLGRSIADAAFDPFYEELNRRGAVLYVHPSGVGAGSPLVSPFDLTWVVGAPIEDTLAAVHLVFRGVTTRFPNIKILVSHIGGSLPVLLGRLDFLYRDELPPMAVAPSALLRRMWFDSVAHGDCLAIEAAHRAFGPTQVVLGSDFPYQLDEAYTDAVQFLFRTTISKQDAQAVLDVNAERLLGDWLTRRSA
jgi:predicted TIM-barrel fold metal-dependent hydrolase